jgi:hypothetical protein
MAVTPEATEHVERLWRHMVQVEAGLIPSDSPVTYLLEDSVLGDSDQKTVDAMAEAVARMDPPEVIAVNAVTRGFRAC